MSEPRTLGELKPTSPGTKTSVKEEMRRNLLKKLQAGGELFPGIVGYEETVIPQIENALLSRHDMLFQPAKKCGESSAAAQCNHANAGHGRARTEGALVHENARICAGNVTSAGTL